MAIRSGFKYYAGAGQVRFIADGQVVPGDAALPHQGRERFTEGKSRFAGTVLDDADALQGDGVTEPRAHCFRKRLFRSKAVGQIQHLLLRYRVSLLFNRGQHAADKS